MQELSVEAWINKQINMGRAPKFIVEQLNKAGYRTPEGKYITNPDINRYLAGQDEAIKPPETVTPLPLEMRPKPPERKTIIIPPTEAVEPLTPEEISRLEQEEQDRLQTRAELRQDLEDGEAAKLEAEENLPPLVPYPGDYGRSEKRPVARVHAVFNRREDIELDELKTFYGIPVMRRQQKVTVAPHAKKYW